MDVWPQPPRGATPQQGTMPRRMIYATPVLCFDFNKQGVCHGPRRGDAARLMHAWYLVSGREGLRGAVVYLLVGFQDVET